MYNSVFHQDGGVGFFSHFLTYILVPQVAIAEFSPLFCEFTFQPTVKLRKFSLQQSNVVCLVCILSKTV